MALSSSARVARHRMELNKRNIKTIQVNINKDEIAILDAVALKAGVSRSLYLSILIKQCIYGSPFFVSDRGDVIDTSY